MTTLESRIRELKQVTGWSNVQTAKAAGVSRSAVAQWLGQSTRPTLSLDMKPAMNLQHATGFCAEWLATGAGPKRVAGSAPVDSKANVASEARPPTLYDLPSALDVVGMALKATQPTLREAVATNLAGWAREGGADHWRRTVQQLLTPGKRVAA